MSGVLALTCFFIPAASLANPCRWPMKDWSRKRSLASCLRVRLGDISPAQFSYLRSPTEESPMKIRLGTTALTLAVLIVTSIIGPMGRVGRVSATNNFAQLDVVTQTFTTRDGVTTPYVIDPGTVPGTISLARYIPPSTLTPGALEHGYRGSVDPCATHYALDCSNNPALSCTGDNGACATVSVPDSALGDQTGLTGTAALDHQWIQGNGANVPIYQLPATSSTAIVFPSIDHNAGLYEAAEFTVWGLPAGTPLQAFTPGAPWVEGRLVRVFKDGWSAHAAGTPYCNSFPFPIAGSPEQFDTDD